MQCLVVLLWGIIDLAKFQIFTVTVWNYKNWIKTSCINGFGTVTWLQALMPHVNIRKREWVLDLIQNTPLRMWYLPFTNMQCCWINILNDFSPVYSSIVERETTYIPLQSYSTLANLSGTIIKGYMHEAVKSNSHENIIAVLQRLTSIAT